MLLPLKDDNPHPAGWKPYMTYMLIVANAGVFIFEIIVTGQFIDFTNGRALQLFYEWGAVPQCIDGADTLTLDFGRGPFMIECPNNALFTLISSTFLHGGILHLGGNMLFLWIFGDNIEAKFGRFKYLGIYLTWGVLAGLVHVAGDFSSTIPAVGASGAVSGILGAYLVLFPRAPHTDCIYALFLLAHDTHTGKMVFAVLACVPEFVAVLCERVWCGRWRRGLSGTHWRVCGWPGGWLHIQKDVHAQVHLWDPLRVQVR